MITKGLFEDICNELQEKVDEIVDGFLVEIKNSLDIVRREHAANETQQNPQLCVKVKEVVSEVEDQMDYLGGVVTSPDS